MSKTISEIHNIHIKGKGVQPMLFAHGFGCDQAIWRYITEPFEGGYKLVLIDYIGSGKSDISYYDEKKYSSLEGYADDILGICKELRLQDVIFVGHSISCMIGMLAAIREPGLFSRIIMIAPSPCYINDAGYIGGFEKREVEDLFSSMERNFIEWASFLGPAIMGNAERPELGKELKERFCEADRDITKQFARVSFYSDLRSHLKLLQVPVLIMQCAEDVLAPAHIGEFLNDQIKCSTLRRMQASGHCPHLSAPNETINVIKNYLDTTG